MSAPPPTNNPYSGQVVTAYVVPNDAPIAGYQSPYYYQGAPPAADGGGTYHYYQSYGGGFASQPGAGGNPYPPPPPNSSSYQHWADEYDVAERGGTKGHDDDGGGGESDDDDDDNLPLVTSEIERQLFLARVYGLLTFQLLITTIICLSFSLYSPLTSWSMSTLNSSPLLLWLGFGGGGILSLLFLMCFRSVPFLNLLLLLVFTVLEACLLGVLCAAYESAGLGVIVLEAAVLSTSSFLIMTLVALTTKRDMTCLGASLGFVLPPLMLWSLLNSFFPNSPFFSASSLIYASVSAAVFLLFTLYDTWSIARRIPHDEYVLATVTLYLDLINLFVDVLRILAALAGNNSSSEGGGREND